MKRKLPALSCLLVLAVSAADRPIEPSRYPGASHVPDSKPDWQRFQTSPDPAAPEDEAQGGVTARGTKIAKRNEHCFPAENRNVFSDMDWVASGAGGALEPFDYTANGVVSDVARNAIRGRNTWLLWGEGNEAFWGWLQEEGYGLVDFLVLLDSRNRPERFKKLGLMNQPGMLAQTDPTHRILGLYLDKADGPGILLNQPENDLVAKNRLAERPYPPPNHQSRLFEPWNQSEYDHVLAQLPQDGVDPAIYGYPSGVVGLRLFPNPDFFGMGDAAQQARKHWNDKVESSGDEYYRNRTTAADPELVRPFRVSMSCGFCHVGPHPLNPPADPEAPKWENLSSVIGNQYWSPVSIFANLTQKDSILNQFLASQQPGTVDTSLVSTDHINNANTINAVFDVPARLARAGENRPERQGEANLLVRSLEEQTNAITPRHTPRVLLDGADSIGVFGALSRVYLNIGTHPREWARCHNPLIGFKPQRPFSVATLKKASVYWRSADEYRIPYLAAFFTYESAKTHASIAAPMKLQTAVLPAGVQRSSADPATISKGRSVFLSNCAVCHSSKQPKNVTIDFSSDWKANAGETSAHLTLPMRFQDWDAFIASGAFQSYRRLIADIAKEPAGGRDEWLENNFLSTDIRVPITLVGTNSGRAVGTNGMRGQVWDNFSSDDYKQLPAVGKVAFYNPYSGAPADAWGNNDTYAPPGGGPGYYRPASLISLWATAPYFHNNALGRYNSDPSVQGRLAAFDDGIDRLLWKKKRVVDPQPILGGLPTNARDLASHDPGVIYRTSQTSYVAIPAKFIKALFVGTLGPGATRFLTLWLWVIAAAVALLLAAIAVSRHVGFVLLVVAIASALAILVLRLDRLSWFLWLVPAVAVTGTLVFWLREVPKPASRSFFGAAAILSLALAWLLTGFVEGRHGDLRLGPIPQGTPINLVMNINPEAPPSVLLRAAVSMLRGIVASCGASPAEALRAFEREAGQALLNASKCPDFVLDRGHWFAEELTDEEKIQLKAFLRTL